MTAYRSRQGAARTPRPGADGCKVVGEAFTVAIGRFLGTVVVTLRGTLDTLAATRLAATLHDLINGQGNLDVALDLRGLEHVGPSGLRVLAVAAAALERRGGSLWLSEPNERVRAALDEARLSRFVGDRRRQDRPTSGPGVGAARPLPSAGAPPGRASHPAGTGRRGDPKGGRR